jgi:hypothetical protein
VNSQLRHVNVTRYSAPLREGGSLPALVEADDQFMYVLKFRGAGQGKKALIAELIGGEIARALGFRVPELVFANLDVAFGRIEGDEEIQDLLKASVGLNLALHYLSGAVTYDPLVTKVDFQLASDIVWLDSLILNVDRTVRNTNMLWWHKELWLIDHGAALYFHHSWQDWKNPERPFPKIKDHVMLPLAVNLRQADEKNKVLITEDKIRSIVAMIPDEWLSGEPTFNSIEEHREAYRTFILNRVKHSDFFVNEAIHARESRF